MPYQESQVATLTSKSTAICFANNWLCKSHIYMAWSGFLHTCGTLSLSFAAHVQKNEKLIWKDVIVAGY